VGGWHGAVLENICCTQEEACNNSKEQHKINAILASCIVRLRVVWWRWPRGHCLLARADIQILYWQPRQQQRRRTHERARPPRAQWWSWQWRRGDGNNGDGGDGDGGGIFGLPGNGKNDHVVDDALQIKNTYLENNASLLLAVSQWVIKSGFDPLVMNGMTVF
jgi:hypothetical protein